MQSTVEPESGAETSADMTQAHSRRGIAFAIPAQGCRLIVHFASICILSRMLTPDDFGVAGMVLSVTGFLELFKDAGLGMALIQAETLPSGVVSTLFWIVAAVSITLGGLMLGSGPLMASLYREPRVVELVPMLAMAIVANGFAVVPQAMMRRDLKFGQLAFVEVVSPLCGVGVAIAAALNGFSYHALAIQPLVLAIMSSLLCWYFCPIWPGKPRWTEDIRRAIYFGGHLSGFGFVNYWARNADRVLIGRYWGAAELGMYVRAYALLTAPLNLINNPLSSVYVPLLSRLQNRPKELRHHYLRGLSLATSISLPLSATLIVCAEEVVRILLGQEWTEVVGIFRMLCISAPLQFCGNTTGWLFAALGRTDRQFRWGLFASTIIVISFFVGLPWSSKGVALSYSCVGVPLTFLNFWYATRDTEISAMDVLQCCLPATLFALALGLVLMALKWAFAPLTMPIAHDCLILSIASLAIGVSMVMELRRRSHPRDVDSFEPHLPQAVPIP